MYTLKKSLFILLVSTIAMAMYHFYPDKYPTYSESDHYSAKTGRFFNTLPERETKVSEILSALWQMVFHKEKFMPPAPLPMEKPDFTAFLQEGERAKFIWFGHSTLLMRMADQTIFVDPVFAESVSPIPLMMKRFQPTPASLEELPMVDWIVLSHNHYDHLDEKVIAFYQSQNTRFIVPLGVGVMLQKWGISAARIQEVDWWQSVQLGGVEITATPARHNTGRGLFDKNKTLWTGYVFKTATEQFYYSGDSSWGDGAQFRQIAEKFGQFDIAFIENGQYNAAWRDNHLFPEETAEVAHTLKPKRFMPIHWGAYALSLHGWSESVEQSIPKVEQYGIKPLTAIQGQVFDSQTATDYWWKTVKAP